MRAFERGLIAGHDQLAHLRALLGHPRLIQWFTRFGKILRVPCGPRALIVGLWNVHNGLILSQATCVTVSTGNTVVVGVMVGPRNTGEAR